MSYSAMIASTRASGMNQWRRSQEQKRAARRKIGAL